MEKLTVKQIRKYDTSVKLYVFLRENLKEINYSVMSYDRIFFRNALYNLNSIIIAFPKKLQLAKEELQVWESIFNDGIENSKKFENLRPLGERVINFWNDYQSSF